MRVSILLQITDDDGASSSVEEVATFEKATEQAEDVGLSLADGKALAAAVQRRVVQAQAAAWAAQPRHQTLCRPSAGDVTEQASQLCDTARSSCIGMPPFPEKVGRTSAVCTAVQHCYRVTWMLSVATMSGCGRF